MLFDQLLYIYRITVFNVVLKKTVLLGLASICSIKFNKTTTREAEECNGDYSSAFYLTIISCKEHMLPLTL
jgi:hypothetical protein